MFKSFILFTSLFVISTFSAGAQTGAGKFVVNDSFLVYMKTVLNPYKYGWKNDRFFPYSTRYGRRTGWGLPVKDKKIFQSGQTQQEADAALWTTIEQVIPSVDSFLRKNFPASSLDALTKDAQWILVDRAVTEGVDLLPLDFCQAVIVGNWNKLINDYLYIRSTEGWPDIIRNKAFADRWIYGKTGQPLPLGN